MWETHYELCKGPVGTMRVLHSDVYMGSICATVKGLDFTTKGDVYLRGNNTLVIISTAGQVSFITREDIVDGLGNTKDSYYSYYQLLYKILQRRTSFEGPLDLLPEYNQ
jgi:hypothetical protein